MDPTKILDNSTVQVVYYAILIIALFMMVYYLKNLSSKQEDIIGSGLVYSTGAITSGATQRFATYPTSTDMGAAPTYNADLRHPSKLKSEFLTATREPPVFWDISQTLGEYQYATQFSCADGNPPMPVKDHHGNTYYACSDGSTPVQSLHPAWQTQAQHSTGTVVAPTTPPVAPPVASHAEWATSSPDTAVQEELLRNRLHY